MPIQSNPKDVVAALRSAFGAVQRPQDDEIAGSLDGPHADEASELARKMRGRTWEDFLTMSRPELLWGDLGFYSTAGLRYYLPGYLIRSIEDPVFRDEFLQEISFLFRSEPYSDSRRIKAVAALLNREQKAAVAMYLQYMDYLNDKTGEFGDCLEDGKTTFLAALNAFWSQ